METTQSPDRLSTRVTSVDLCRGIVMILMALDHVRDYLHVAHFNAGNLAKASSPLFLTRWVTHLCAPGFMFLAGVSAFLVATRGKTKKQLRRFLLTRGLWLVLLEHTVVRFAWHFNLDYSNGLEFLVLWALGASMIVLAGLSYLPRWAIVLISVAMIAGHNILDRYGAAGFGRWEALWRILHEPGPIQFAGRPGFVLYPLIPWIGVMAAGYALGPVFLARREVRRRWLFFAGSLAIAVFAVVRAINKYGDPAAWTSQSTHLRTVLSFLNTQKYPPSLLYLLMTLGPLFVALAVFDVTDGPASRVISVIGRVPMFFYLLHIYLIHAITVAVGVWKGFPVSEFFRSFVESPETFGIGLPAVCAWWLIIVAALYFPCRWFAEYKQTHRLGWLSYL